MNNQLSQIRHTKDSIKNLLLSNDKAVLRGLLVIHGLQTATEREYKSTDNRNSVGFSLYHAEFGSSLAEQYRARGSLSPKQVQAARKMMVHYAAQLARVANGEIPHPFKKQTGNSADKSADQNADQNANQNAIKLTEELKW